MTGSEVVVLSLPENGPRVMVPMYFPGEDVVVRQEVFPQPGEVVIGVPLREGVFDYFAYAGVYCGGHGTCGRDECQGMPEGCLVPVNRNFPPLPRRDVQVLGVVEGKA